MTTLGRKSGSSVARRAHAWLAAVAVAVLAGGCGHAPRPGAPAAMDAGAALPNANACTALSALSLPGPPSGAMVVLSAQVIPAGPLPADAPAATFPPMRQPAALPAYCKVSARISPAIRKARIWRFFRRSSISVCL